MFPACRNSPYDTEVCACVCTHACMGGGGGASFCLYFPDRLNPLGSTYQDGLPYAKALIPCLTNRYLPTNMASLCDFLLNLDFLVAWDTVTKKVKKSVCYQTIFPFSSSQTRAHWLGVSITLKIYALKTLSDIYRYDHIF